MTSKIYEMPLITMTRRSYSCQKNTDEVQHCNVGKQHTLSICDFHLYAMGLEGMAQSIF